MNSLPRWLSLAALASLSLVARPSFAQGVGAEPQVTGSSPSYSVAFDDDALNALPGNALIPRIVVRRGPARTMLLRPRVSFVTEMLKSVEGI